MFTFLKGSVQILVVHVVYRTRIQKIKKIYVALIFDQKNKIYRRGESIKQKMLEMVKVTVPNFFNFDEI